MMSWSIFDELDRLHGDVAPAAPSPDRVSSAWTDLDEFIASHSAVLDSLYLELNPLLAEWNRRLASLGGDPTLQDWSRFRPLRLSREEDWSDWLAFLLERSDAGVFAARLLGADGGASIDHARPAVEREISHDGHRADLVVEWAGGRCAHVEVKIGDDGLAKTFGTGRRMRLRYGRSVEEWENFVLLLPSQIEDWAELESTEPAEPPVEVLSWIDVCVALRGALVSHESLVWRAWAYAFVGAVEQRIIRFPGHRLPSRPPSGLEAKVGILREALTHGSCDGPLRR
jgi:hypothetical protein